METECLIIGGGPAGLMAGIYLGRYKRQVTIIDSGQSRAAYIPASHNYPGFMSISGEDLLQRMRRQAVSYGASLLNGEVYELSHEDGRFTARFESGVVKARKVLIATGICDVSPNLPNLKTFIYNGAVRYCPVCDGYEAAGKRIGILGYLDHIINKAVFLRRYSHDIVILAMDTDLNFNEKTLSKLKHHDISVPHEPVCDICIQGNEVVAVMASGARIELDVLYPAMGFTVRTHFLKGLLPDCNDQNCLVTNSHQRTNIEGLWATGDLTTDLSQISVALGQSAIAATDMHNALLQEEGI